MFKNRNSSAFFFSAIPVLVATQFRVPEKLVWERFFKIPVWFKLLDNSRAMRNRCNYFLLAVFKAEFTFETFFLFKVCLRSGTEAKLAGWGWKINWIMQSLFFVSIDTFFNSTDIDFNVVAKFSRYAIFFIYISSQVKALLMLNDVVDKNSETKSK